MSILSLGFAIWFVPELKGRGLEEVDELFEQFHWGWQYKHIETHGYGAQIARLAAGDRAAALEVENRKGDEEDSKVSGQGRIKLTSRSTSSTSRRCERARRVELEGLQRDWAAGTRASDGARGWAGMGRLLVWSVESEACMSRNDGNASCQ